MSEIPSFTMSSKNSTTSVNSIATPISSSMSSNSNIVSSNAVIVNDITQRKNPILQHVKNKPIEFVQSIKPDFIVGASACVLFLSVRYHLLHSQYIKTRINDMKDVMSNFKLKVLLLLVDVEDNKRPIIEINKICFENQFTLLLSWSMVEAARYLETLKAYEIKDSSSIMERVDTDFTSKIQNSLTQISSINKTDVVTLLDAFGSLKNICSADEQQLLLCPGIGEKKMKRLFDTLHTPFKSSRRKEHSDSSKEI